jgi:hypothetical protein
MQLDFMWRRKAPEEDFLMVGGRRVPLAVVRSGRARRYLLRLRPEGTVRLTIPRRGSVGEGRRFAERQTEWLARQLEKLAAQPVRSKEWRVGMEILFRGEWVKVQAGAGVVRLGDELIKVSTASEDLRPGMEKHLWRIAAREFPPLVMAWAAVHQLMVRRVTVRNQRSRWGSCSRQGTISLNWRLIQTPPFVRDYIILHELMHLRQMNHSARFWREVALVCPDFAVAEKWLKAHGGSLK